MNRLLVVLAIYLSCSASSFAAHVMTVQPIAVFDSRWDGSTFGSVGSNNYLPNVNGPYVPTFATRTDSIYSQCMIDVTFLPTISFDSATFLNVSSSELDVLLRTGFPTPAADPDVENFLNGLGGPSAHHVFFVNSHPGTPAGPAAGADPISGSWGMLGGAGGGTAAAVAGIATRPNAGGVAAMRSVMAQSDDINNAASEASWASSNGITSVLAHELGHNLSLQHVTSPTDNLMLSGVTGTGTQSELSVSQCNDAVATGVANGTVTAVPEPNAFALLGLVFGMVTLAQKLRNRQNPSDAALMVQ